MLGCLFELFIFPLEMFVEAVAESWIYVVTGGRNDDEISPVLEIFLSVMAHFVWLMIGVIFLIGLLIAIFTEKTVLDLWGMVLVPPALLLVQIILIVIVKKRKKKK